MHVCRIFFNRRSHPYVIFFYVTTFLIILSTTIVLWKFKNECYQFPTVQSEEYFANCGHLQQTRQFKRRNLSSVSYDFSFKKSHKNSEEFDHSRLKVGSSRKGERINTNEDDFEPQEPEFESVTVEEKHRNFNELRVNVTNYFKDRRKFTEEACLNLIPDEEKIHFEPENEEMMLGELKKLERLERGESKNFMDTAAGKRTRWIFYRHYDPKNNIEIQWCPLYKSASTPWMAVFTKLAKALTRITEVKIRKGKITFVTLARNFRLYVSKSQIPPVSTTPRYSMIVVRHPFQRLLSAYRDKIERTKGREYYYKKYSKKIVERFRKMDIDGDLNANIRQNGPKIPLWFQMAMDLQRHFYYRGKPNNRMIKKQPQSTEDETDKSENRISSISNNHRYINYTEETTIQQKLPSTTKNPGYEEMVKKFNIPTFDEFCRYLLTVDPKNMDEHWQPQFLSCSPCHNQFDLILKVEELEKDKQEVFKLLGYFNDNSADSSYSELNEVWNKWINPSKGSRNESFYFSQLSESTMQSLFNIYQLDFELFGYSADEYFEMVTQVSFE